MLNFLLIFLGAGIGGSLRYIVIKTVYWYLGQQFPYGTLLVNVSGCLFMGFLYMLLLNRYPEIAPELGSFLLIGVLGGYTTFSTFAMETFVLLNEGAWISASINILLTVILCMLAVWLGFLGGKRL